MEVGHSRLGIQRPRLLGRRLQGIRETHLFKGAYLKDPKRLFNASLEGRTMRAIDFNQGDKIDNAGVEALVRDAVAFNAITKRR